MRGWKAWLCDRFLPAFCREALVEENNKLQNALNCMQVEVREMKAYARGLEAGLRAVRKMRLAPPGGEEMGKGVE